MAQRMASTRSPTTPSYKKKVRAARKPQVFRFLDLPPELRNRVYSYTLEYHAPPQVNLLATRIHAPSALVTIVSRQLRHESLDLYHQAMHDFWTKRSFHLSLNDDIAEDERCKEVISVCTKVPITGITRFEFRIPRLIVHGREHTMHILVLFEDDEEVVWKWWWAGSRLRLGGPNAEATAKRAVWFENIVESQGFDWVCRAEHGGLDVGKCVHAICEYVFTGRGELRHWHRL